MARTLLSSTLLLVKEGPKESCPNRRTLEITAEAIHVGWYNYPTVKQTMTHVRDCSLCSGTLADLLLAQHIRAR